MGLIESVTRRDGVQRLRTLAVAVVLVLVAAATAVVVAPSASSADSPPEVTPGDLEPGIPYTTLKVARGATVTMSMTPQPTLDAGGHDVGLGGHYLCGELGCIDYGVGWVVPANATVVQGCTVTDWTCTVRFFPSYVGEHHPWEKASATFGRGQTQLGRQLYFLWAPPLGYSVVINALDTDATTPLTFTHLFLNPSSAYAIRSGADATVDSCTSGQWWLDQTTAIQVSAPDCIVFGLQRGGLNTQASWAQVLPLGGSWDIYPFDYAPSGSIRQARHPFSTVHVAVSDADVSTTTVLGGGSGTTTTTTTSTSTTTSTTTTIPTATAPQPPVVTAAVVGAQGSVSGTVVGAPASTVTITIAAAVGRGTTCPKQLSGAGITTVGVASTHLDGQGHGTWMLGGLVPPGAFLYGTASALGQTSAVGPCFTTPSDSLLAARSFVRASYQDFLGRAADAAALGVWSGRLDRGEVSRSAYLNQLVSSDEWRAREVGSAYQRFLGRPGDAAGVALWTQWLRSGRSESSLIAAFLASPEYAASHGGATDAARWVTSLYQALLHRSPDPAGLSYWVARVGDAGRPRVAEQIYGSPESRSLRVGEIFQALLGRSPDPGGLAYWTATIKGSDDLVVSTAVAATAEYSARARTRFP